MAEFIYKMIENDTYCLMGYHGDDTYVIVPKEYCGKPVTIIYDELFKGHTEITSVAIPDSIMAIGGFVFDGCENLKEISLPESLTDMWQYAFVRSSIEQIEIPGSVKHIIPFVFKDCQNLKQVVLNPGTEKIFGYAFQGCTNLEEVRMPEATVIDPRAFEGCPQVNVVRY